MSNSIRRTMSGYCKLNIRTNTNSICSWRRKIKKPQRKSSKNSKERKRIQWAKYESVLLPKVI